MTDFWRFAKLMLQHRATLVWAMVFAFISAVGFGVGLMSLAPMLKLVLAEGGKSLVDLATEHNQDAEFVAIPTGIINVLPTTPFGGVQLMLGVVVGLTMIGALCNFAHMYLSAKLTMSTVGEVRQSVFDRVVFMPLGRVVERGPSQLVARIVRDSVDLQRGFIAITSKMVAQITKGLAAFAVALVLNWKLAAASVILAPILAVILRRVGKSIVRGATGALEAQEQLLRIASENLQGIRAVKANTGEQQASSKFSVQNLQAVRQVMRIYKARAISSPLVETMAILVLCLLALPASKLILADSLDFEIFILTIGALGLAGVSLRPLTGLVNEVQAASAPAVRIAQLLDEPLETEEPERGTPAQRHTRSITFEHVSLTYPGADEPALRDVTVEITHGERVALVGPNGCGKTTLVSTLPRLIVPQHGRVLIDGVDVQSLMLQSLRRQIGVVTQETVLFRGSIADNLAFGLEEVSREQIIHAAEQAHAHEFIERIPGGYDADIAEQGASLSGGQRQRLAIARAILRDPAILILDEATSQIDAESEKLINDAIVEFCHGRTAIIVAHRLATVLSADRIVVMDRGEVVAHGPHAQLLQTCELYARLTQTQLIPSE